MSTLSQFYTVGQKIEVIIKKPKIGRFPIASVVGHNVVCLFERSKKFFEIGSTWEVEITEVKTRNLVIKPIKLVQTKAQNEGDMQDKLKELQAMYKR